MFDANADNDEADLLKHFYMHHDLTEKPHILQCLKLRLGKNPKLHLSMNVKIKSFTQLTISQNIFCQRLHLALYD